MHSYNIEMLHLSFTGVRVDKRLSDGQKKEVDNILNAGTSTATETTATVATYAEPGRENYCVTVNVSLPK